MGNIKKTLGSNIRKLRKIKNLTQTDLSELAGVSFRALQRLESGATTPHSSTLESLAEALGVLQEELYKEEIKANNVQLASKAELIASIVARISALNETELLAIDAIIRHSVAFGD